MLRFEIRKLFDFASTVQAVDAAPHAHARNGPALSLGVNASRELIELAARLIRDDQILGEREISVALLRHRCARRAPGGDRIERHVADDL